MVDKTELMLKALEQRVTGLERTIDRMEKASRAAGDPKIKLGDLDGKLTKLEKALATKKDKKSADDERRKKGEDQNKAMQKSNEKMIANLQLDVKFRGIENRLGVLEALIRSR